MELIRHILDAARPRQWIKNLLLLTPLLLDGKLFVENALLHVLSGVIAFCFISSSNYLLNDILDAASDKEHPFKKSRPLARDLITTQQALLAAVVFGVSGVAISFSLGQSFASMALLFILLHYLSYFFFRRVPVLDVLMLASGYVLRVIAGELAAGATMSVWLFLTMLAASLLLAIGKRRSELNIVQSIPGSVGKKQKDEFLYSERVLDAYVAVFASATFLSYVYFTFLSTVSANGIFFHGYTTYVLSIIGRKWMMLTVPFVLYGIMRYLQLVYTEKGMLAKVILSDRPLIVTAFLWFFSVLFVVYGIGGY